MKLDDLLDVAELAQMLETRMVRVRHDEELPVEVYEYTENAQYKRVWNPVTLQCRGLIVDTRTQEVLARPLPKFFNHGEPDAPVLTGPVDVYDKLDGSCGIMYLEPGTGRPRISTRLSLRSPQAVSANAVLDAKYPDFVPRSGWTYVFEIITSTSRVVLDYGAQEDLFFIAAIDIESGRSVDFDRARATWPGPAVERFSFSTLEEALAAPPRPNAEGYVVHDPVSDQRVKIKQDDYKVLHGIITGLRRVDLWKLLLIEDTQHLPAKTVGQVAKTTAEEVEELRVSSALSQESLWAKVPDELFAHVQQSQRDILDEVESAERSLRESFAALGLDDLPTRRQQAALIMAQAPDKFTRDMWLALLSGASIRLQVWRQLRPDPRELVAHTLPATPVWGGIPG